MGVNSTKLIIPQAFLKGQGFKPPTDLPKIIIREGYGRLLNLNSRKEAADFIDGQIKRTLNFNKTVLLPAVQTMTSTLPNEEEYEKLTRLLNRHLSKDSARNLVEGVTSNWDAFNAVTAAANQVTSVIARQQLQIAGGAMLEQFMKV